MFPVHPRAGLGSGLHTLEAKTFARSPCHPNTDPLCLLVSPRGLFVGGIQADHDLDNVFAFVAELDLKIDPREAALPRPRSRLAGGGSGSLGGLDEALRAAGVCTALPIGLHIAMLSCRFHLPRTKCHPLEQAFL